MIVERLTSEDEQTPPTGMSIGIGIGIGEDDQMLQRSGTTLFFVLKGTGERKVEKILRGDMRGHMKV